MTMAAAPSTLSLAAAFLYAIVAFTAMIAASRAILQRQVSWHRWLWVIVAVLFMIFALLRVFAVEELLRGDMRAILYQDNTYAERSAVQKPLVAALFLCALSFASGMIYLFAKRVSGRRNVAAVGAIACTGAMILLAALRLVSLHSVDALLYGPLKLNWFMDLGLSIAVMACALRYRLVVQRLPG